MTPPPKTARPTATANVFRTHWPPRAIARLAAPVIRLARLAKATGARQSRDARQSRVSGPKRRPARPRQASMKSSICRATARMSNKASTRLRPARASSARRSGASSNWPSAAARPSRVARIGGDRARAADLGQAAAPGGDERRAARHRFERRSAERFGAGRQHHADRGALPRRLDLGIGNVRIDPDPAVESFSRGAKRAERSPAPGRRRPGRTA